MGGCGLLRVVYSYFEKGCRKNCARDNPERHGRGLWAAGTCISLSTFLCHMSMVAHNCHGKTKNVTAKPKTSRQKQNTSRQNQKPQGKNKIPHGKTKNFTAKTKYVTSKPKKPHGKTKYFTAKTK